MSIRIIYECCSSKYIKQYEQINKLIPKHELFIYSGDTTNLKHVDYNIYLDCINENIYLNTSCKKTILVVNEEYLTYSKYLKRESYIDKPLILLKDIIDFYICLTKYTYNILSKNISKNKLLLINNACYNIYNNINYTFNKKYILYNIDLYSWQDNLLIINTWLKYFSNNNEILIIKYNIIKESFIIKLNKLMAPNKIKNNKINYYKNIIIIDSEVLITQFEKNIQSILIISSYFNLITVLNENILKKRFIITLENEISRELITYTDYLIKDMTEISLYKAFSKYFELNLKEFKILTNKNEKQFIINKPKLPIKLY